MSCSLKASLKIWNTPEGEDHSLVGLNLTSSFAIPAKWNRVLAYDIVNLHTISISSAGMLHLTWEWYGFSTNSCSILYSQ